MRIIPIIHPIVKGQTIVSALKSFPLKVVTPLTIPLGEVAVVRF